MNWSASSLGIRGQKILEAFAQDAVAKETDGVQNDTKKDVLHQGRW
jgi:hypothetical protein